MVTRPGGRSDELVALLEPILDRLEAAHRAREAGLAACRRTIRACGQAIRAVHRREPEEAERFTAQAREALREAQEALGPHPAVAFAGFLHDAEKEYAEAVLTVCLVGGGPLPEAAAIGVQPVAWLGGLCEAASELRRHLLDRMRAGELEVAEDLLHAMEDVYDLLVTVDYPDALTGGLRRMADALRAVLERSRADLTTTFMQSRLQAALQERLKD
ncbi:MAG: haloacid dehalogenase [Actinomycetota bacterium]|nr:haloacid dehalogenase [Actinomycetota bacterium]